MKQEKNIRLAVKNFFSKEYSKLINYVHSYFREFSYSMDAEDIIQDVALNIYSKADINAPIENLTAYVYRSVKNKIIDIRRKRKGSMSIEDLDNKRDKSILTETDSGVEEDFYRDENVQKKMMEAMDKLKSAERDIIIETEFNERSFNDLSTEWNTPVGTLLARKHRALGKLQKELQNEKKKYNL
ncbi:MAG: sigma-70 family RNA polymerase sigma factor [Bacteroidales bacterium]|nr:MAG: sigma-70 family RNA polymerase sigma factor [Bacteroidales bacterium]